MHCDLTNNNVLVEIWEDKKAHPIIIDLGISKLAKDSIFTEYSGISHSWMP